MFHQLRPVPDTPPRAVLYLRQSISRDDSISLELQEIAARDYCLRQGYHVVAREADPGISGRTWKRPAVQRVMAMIEEGRADVIVLWRWSRLSRSRKDWAVAADRVEVAGGRIESATEPNDPTAAGRFARGVMTELAAFESERIGESWKEVHQSRLARGLAPNGSPRFGYVFDKADSIHKPHPVDGPALTSAYERYVAGESFYAIVETFNARGLVTIKGGPWSVRSLQRCMDHGFGAGMIRWGDQLVAGVHEALVGPELWQSYLDRRATARSRPPITRRSQYLLSGLVRCGKCGAGMTGQPHPLGPKFRCNRSKMYGKAGCPGAYINMSVLERRVRAWLEEVRDSVDAAAEAVDRSAAVRLSADAEARRLAAAVGRVDAALQRLTVQLAEELVPESAYQAARDELLGKRSGLVDRLEEVGRTVRRPVADPASTAGDLLESWEEGLSVEVRREMLRALIEKIVVTTNGQTTAKGVAGGSSTAKIEILPV